MEEIQLTESTPVITSDVNTSSNDTLEQAGANTVSDELTEEHNAAETEEPTRKFANKFESVEKLEEAYSHAVPFMNKAADLEKEVAELRSKIEGQVKQEAQIKLEQAKTQGYETVEDHEISQKVQLQEFEQYASAISNVDYEYREIAKQQLLNYYNTADRRYLNEAKKYFNVDFIEEVAQAKKDLEQKLTSEADAKSKEQSENQRKLLIDEFETDNKDFVANIQNEQGKLTALKVMMGANLIASKEDLGVFVNLYNQIGEEYMQYKLAQEAGNQEAEELKKKAQVPTSGGYKEILNSDEMPTYAQFVKMPQLKRNKLYEKWGDKLFETA